MSDATIKTSIEGKIHNLPHFKSEALLPLFEAVVNSIQAIEEVGDISHGSITVRIKRDTRQAALDMGEDDSLANITGFEIEDSGIGFNDRNLDSFRTADSTYKLAKGGKGVGRFLWLKAFDRVEIESVFGEPDNTIKKRNIEFNIKVNLVFTHITAPIMRMSKSSLSTRLF